MTAVTHDIVAKLWNLCNVLKDDGVTYHQYVTELTYLLFLKMAQETGTEDQLPEGYRWGDLEAQAGAGPAASSTRSCWSTSAPTGPGWCRRSSPTPAPSSSKPATLSTLVAEIDKLDWYSARQEGLGDLYEGLLQKNANEKKSGAGQYFTPRPLIDCMVAVMQPDARRTSSRTRPPAPAASSSPPTATCATHRRLRSAGPRPSSSKYQRATPSTAWSTCRTPTASR